MNNSDTQSKGDKAGAALGLNFGSVAAAISVLTVCAYLMAWRLATGYFDKLGAPWLLESMDGQDYLRFAGPYFEFMLVGMLVVLLNSSVEVSLKTSIGFCLVFLIGGFTSQLAYLLPASWISLRWQQKVLFDGLLFAFAGVGTGIAVWVLAFRRAGSAVTTWQQAVPAALLIVVGCWMLPEFVGRAAGAVDGNAVNSRLARIWRCAEGDEGWRRVSRLGDRVLIVRLRVAEHPVFRVVSESDGWLVTSVDNPAAIICKGH